MAKNLLLTLLAAIGLVMPSCSQTADSIPMLESQTFIAQAKADKKAIIIDVRTPDEYAADHLPNALLIDYLNTPVFQQRIKKLKHKHTYYIYCRSGKRSHAACQQMQARGLTVYDMKGGIIGYTAQGLPTVKE